MAESVIVIGAGIIGICTAIELLEKGFDVAVIDRDGAAEGTSFGNAGVVSPWSCVPQSMPGLWKKVPKWLLDPEGPLSLRWSYVPHMAPWLLKFFRAGTLDRLPAIADAMLAVNRPSLEMYHQLLAGTGEENLVKDCYYLHVYRSENGAKTTKESIVLPSAQKGERWFSCRQYWPTTPVDGWAGHLYRNDRVGIWRTAGERHIHRL